VKQIYGVREREREREIIERKNLMMLIKSLERMNFQNTHRAPSYTFALKE
jgi:hypothetical protein